MNSALYIDNLNLHESDRSILNDDCPDCDSSSVSSATTKEISWRRVDLVHVSLHNLVGNTGKSGVYTGSMDKTSSNENPHGQGIMVYEDAVYEGSWVMGDWTGFGKWTNKVTGDTYQGGFFDNMKHGLGVMNYADGSIYDGTFLLDKMGKGTLIYPEGNTFWGYWSAEGLPHGRGKYTYTDGRIYDGEFDNGVLSGHGKMTWPDGRWHLGEWSEGEPNGLGLQVLPDGNVWFEGIFINGEPARASSVPCRPKSQGGTLLYRSSMAAANGTLVGPLPRGLQMRKQNMTWLLNGRHNDISS
jgi:hypothetical protein